MGLDSVELVMTWEEVFSIKISDAEAEVLATPRQAADLIEAKLIECGRPRGRDEIDRMVRETTIESTGMREDEFGADLRFIEDMGMD